MRTILHVDDDPNDRCFLEHAWRKQATDASLRSVPGGREALDYLAAAAKGGAGAPEMPCLMLLDLKMPGMSGLELLKELRAHTDLPPFPIIVLSSSNLACDVEMAMQLGASAFVMKPPALTDWIKLVEAIQTFWFAFNSFPGKARVTV